VGSILLLQLTNWIKKELTITFLCRGIDREVANESLRALVIEALKGPQEDFAVAISKTIKNISVFETGVSMAQDLKSIKPDINMINCSILY
jgi:hypothetical protein